MSPTVTIQCRRDAGCPSPNWLNLGMYNIRYSRGFGTPQSIWVTQMGNYDFMLLMETNIPDVVY